LDETRANTGQTKIKECRDEDILRPKGAFMAELMAVLEHRTAGSPRFVSVRAGGKGWLIDGAELVFLVVK